MKNRKNRISVLGLLALVGAIPFYARFEGAAGGGGTGGASGGAAGVADPADDAADPDTDADDATDDADKTVVPKKRLDDTIKESQRHKSEAKKAKDELAKLKADMPTAEELKELREAKAAKDKEAQEAAERKGNYEKVMADNAKKHADEVKRLSDEKEATQRELDNERCVNALSREIPKFTSVAPDEVIDLLLPRVKWNREDRCFEITEKDGSVPTREDGKEMTLAEYVEHWIGSRDHFARHKPLGGSGSDAVTTRRARGGQLTSDDVDKMSNADWEKNRLAILGEAEKNPRRGRQSA